MFIIEQKDNTTKIPHKQWRVLFVRIMMILVFGFILINLFRLQIIQGEENLIRARNISHHESIIRAARGVIYDSNGQILVKNVPAYGVYIATNELKLEEEEAVISKLASMINKDPKELVDTYKLKAYDKEGKPTGIARVTLSTEVNYEQFLTILVQEKDLPGVYVDENPRRSYPYGSSIAHVLGYTGDISEVESKETGLDQNAIIGKEGVEKTYDKELRGIDGKQLETINTFSQEQKIKYSETPVSGNNIYLTIDIKWQKQLEKYLTQRIKETKAFGGAVIIMENDTGDIKAMVNYPSFDNNLFAKGISAQDFSKLNNDTSTPLINRSIALQLPTGSTFKPMVAAAALQEGVITSGTQYQSGCVRLPLYKLCEADNVYLGTMTVVEGIGRSSNVFFCKVGLAMTEKAHGIRTLIQYTDQFGIGQKTGVDLPGEQSGTMASPELKLERQKEQWYLADICNTIIGQGLVTATPIQMVNVANTIANNGKVMKPNLLARIETQNGEVAYQHKPEIIREVKVDKKNFELIKSGMRYAVNGSKGSAWLLRGAPGNPYAKTGSADATEYRGGKKVSGAHSWAIGGFTYKGKGYSFVVHMQEGGRGWQSVPVIREFLDWLY